MNWIERLYEIKNKDLYSQSGEPIIVEYIFVSLFSDRFKLHAIDIGGGDGIYLSNTRHLKNIGWDVWIIDKERGEFVTCENVIEEYMSMTNFLSIDIDGNDYWVLDTVLTNNYKPEVICAEFNAMYTDSRTIAYNPDHVWAGDSYYGFTFEAGKKLAEKHGYKVIFQLANINMFMVRADLIEGLTFPEVTYKQNDFFKLSTREDWVYV